MTWSQPITNRIALAFGAPSTRLDVLHLVATRGSVSVASLMSVLGLTRNGVLVHLRALAEAGLVTGRQTTHPRGAGPITYWSPELDEILLTLDELTSYLVSEIPDADPGLGLGG